MVEKILTGAGLVEGKTFTETCFRVPPKTDYAVYLDDITRRGGDGINLITDHSISIELYEYKKNPNLERKIEAQFDALGVEYEKHSRYWLEKEQLYQVIYDFEYVEKEK